MTASEARAREGDLPFVNPGACEIEGYVPGLSAESARARFGLNDVVGLASNENVLGASPAGAQALADSASDLHRYPDAGSGVLKERLATHLGLTPSYLTIGNGADGVIYNLGMATIGEGCEVLLPRTTFPIYAMIVRIMRGRLVSSPMQGTRIDLDDMARRIGPKTRLVFVCNPNNPTGDALPRAALLAFLKAVPPHVLVVLDEAYIGFASDAVRVDATGLIRGGMRNLFVLRTFSKLHGLAGARIGYGIGDPALVELIDRIKAPFDVSLPGERAAVAALGDHDFVQRTIDVCAAEKRRMYRALDALGLAYVTSHANFVLIDTGRDADAFAAAMARRGVTVRPGTRYGLPTHIRVSVGLEDQNQRFIDALRAVSLVNEEKHVG